MEKSNSSKFGLILIVFFILLVLENMAYANFFMPFYKVFPGDVGRYIPDAMLLLIFFVNLATNFVLIMILTKILFEYENIKKVFIATIITTAFGVIVNFFTIEYFTKIVTHTINTNILDCLVEGSGVFIIALLPLFLLNYIIIRYILKIENMRIFYSLSMAVLINPAYHYVLFYTPLIKLLGLIGLIF